MTLTPKDTEWIASVTGARAVGSRTVRSLWGGYGVLQRIELDGAPARSAIAKIIRPPASVESSSSHLRKCRSYEVEHAFYRDFGARCSDGCRIPRHLGSTTTGAGSIILLEDLDAGGFPRRARQLSSNGRRACLRWLARFHARFLGIRPEGLWPRGTYWHLATRQKELAALEDAELRAAAVLIDRRLATAKYTGLIHGDAKLENFCFSADEGDVAAVDFQYVGGGVGVQDVAYFLASLSRDGRDVTDQALIDAYFEELDAALLDEQPHLDRADVGAHWRKLYEVAAADFYRFFAGWAPHAFHQEEAGRRLLDRVVLDVMRANRHP